MTALLWLRRDLRVHDHPALAAALAAHEMVVPVFCFDDRILSGRHASGARTQFMLESLADLRSELRASGSDLVLRCGAPERVLPELAREVRASEVFMSADVGPYAVRRDLRVASELDHAGIALCSGPGLFAADQLRSLRTRAGEPYTVFSPFHRAWLAQPRRSVLPAPRELPGLPSNVSVGKLPSLADLGLGPAAPDAARGGEHQGRQVMLAFLEQSVSSYDDDRNALGEDRSSRLSPYLHFGCISARELEDRLPVSASGDAFRRQLCWRDFHAHVLLHFPRNARSEFQERYRGTIRWSHAHKPFEAWCEGRTGFPLVDAGMRQLQAEGWMHNRARLVVGSFLTKDLGIDWRWGERWFMRQLIDGDEANNNGNWQWIASVGVDPQPAYRRMFNPARQQERFDPDGVYVRRYVPELRSVPPQFLAEPWRMPEELQPEVGCLIGTDYPEPIVDHAAAREEALARYRS